jgi:periplasmic protein TonB
MKTKTLVMRHWEDVVFENRNRAYGAYALRRAYSKRVILGWGITVALFSALLYLSDLSLPDAADIIAPFKNEKEREIKLSQPPSIPDKPIQRPRLEQPRTSTSEQIVVTTDPVETTADPIENFTSASDDTGLGGSVDGYVDGTVVEPVPEPVVTAPPVIRDFAEVMPEYVGGFSEMMKYIQKKTRYPAGSRRIGISGTVYVRFIVRPDGHISDVEVVRGIAKDCDAEAARVISSMPRWNAGMQNGISVPVRIVVPVKFSLQ